MTPMTHHSPGLIQIMKILGLPGSVTSFTLNASCTDLPVVEVTYYPDEASTLETVTRKFTLMDLIE